MTGTGEESSFRTAMVNGLPVVTTPAEVDYLNAGQFGQALELASQGHPACIVDLSGTGFLDTSGLGVIVQALRRAREGGSELRVVMGLPAVVRIFQVTGIERVVKVFPSLAAATAATPGAAAAVTLDPPPEPGTV